MDTITMVPITGINPNLVAGVVTLKDFYLAPDGEMYRGAYSSRWRIVTDEEVAKMLNLPKFHSAERWSLIALDTNGAVVGIFPGCSVGAWAYGAMPLLGNGSVSRQFYNFDTSLIEFVTHVDQNKDSVAP